jgi:hypothetical protein
MESSPANAAHNLSHLAFNPSLSFHVGNSGAGT